MINREDITRLINEHNREFTIKHIYQELSELMVAVTKYEIRRDDLIAKGTEPTTAQKLCSWQQLDVEDELVDVAIMLEMCKVVYGVTDKVFEYKVTEKMQKNLKRLENGKKK